MPVDTAIDSRVRESQNFSSVLMMPFKVAGNIYILRLCSACHPVVELLLTSSYHAPGTRCPAYQNIDHQLPFAIMSSISGFFKPPDRKPVSSARRN